MAQLDEELKTHIQAAYSRWLEARGFRPRQGQRQMIAATARACAGGSPNIAAIEAGTGTGKTAAYCLAAIPIAQALDKTLVIASVTVALQEQIFMRDLPDFSATAGLEFDFALAKGRRRYVCLKRLEEQLQRPEHLPLLAAAGEPNEDHGAAHQAMNKAYFAGRWNGERDSWPDGVDDALWQPLTTDHSGCANKRCTFFQECPYFEAREQMRGVRVVVANQDLLLADLNLGGGVILPAPEDSIVVVDEAHHLPDKTQKQFAARALVGGAATWAEQAGTFAANVAQHFGRPAELAKLAPRLGVRSSAFTAAMQDIGGALSGLTFTERRDGGQLCRFRLGKIDRGIAEAAAAANRSLGELAQSVTQVRELLGQAAEGELGWERSHEAEDWLPVAGQLQARGESIGRLLRDYAGAAEEPEGAPRFARWISRTGKDVELVSAPIEPGEFLRESLWSRCHAAVVTSATLTAMGRFDRFFDRAGISGVEGVRIPSPFDFPRIATLSIPAMQADPRDYEAHTAEITELLPGLLTEQISALVLFMSWRQLEGVKAALPESLREALLIQGEASKQALTQRHRQRIDAGEPSYLLGLASFAEGVDLPDDYCRHVILAKLPFAAPDNPLDEAIAESAESQGRNPFHEIALPDAAVKLLQACGRLIRHEDDHGRITVLDRRLVTQGYGRALLDSLPPYRRELP